jgi:hypothetical protein
MLPVTIGPPQSGAGLTLFPLVAMEPGDAGYDLLPDALEAGTLVITEVGEAGSVPELVATNRGARDVLVLDGMQLIGAKQNRTVGRTILLGAETDTRIPVSCMEQGRWRYAAASMKSGLYHSPAKVRKQTRAVESAEAASADAASDPCSPSELLSKAQGQVWHAIRDSGDKHRAYSATGAVNDIYDAAGPRMEALMAAFPALDGQVGFVAFLAGGPVGADVLDSPATYARLHDRLVRAHIFEALETQAESNGATPELARSFLEGVTTGDRRPLPTVGRGTYRSLIGTVVGGELELDGKVVHLSAFPS